MQIYAKWLQRLVGLGIVILGMVVILPVVLSGRGRLPERVVDIPPVFKMPDMSTLAQPLPQSVQLPVAQDPQQVAWSQQSPPLEEGEGELDARPKARLPAAAVAIVAEANKAQAEPVQFDKAWSVQLASFKSPQHSAALRDRVRAAGYPVYAKETHLSDGSVHIQVLVGPSSDYEAVKALKKKVSDEFSLAAIIVNFEP